MIGSRMTNNAPSTTSRRHFLDVILGASFLGWLVSIAYPIIRYLKPLPQTGPTGPTHLTRDEASKLEQNKFVIVPVSGQRVLVLQIDQAARAVDTAAETLRLTEERKEFAVGNVLETILAQQDLTRAQTDYANAVADYNKAQYALTRAIGGLK